MAAPLAKAAVIPVTSCVDPQYHRNVRQLSGIVLDDQGKGMPNVTGNLYKFKKDSDGYLESSPDVFTSFVTDEMGRFSLPKLRKGIYRVVLRPPKPYWSNQIVVKVERNGSSGGLIAKLGLLGNCGASWMLPEEVE